MSCSNGWREAASRYLTKYVRQADELSPFAVETRYPGLASPVTKRQHRRAVRIAETVLRWAERQIG